MDGSGMMEMTPTNFLKKIIRFNGTTLDTILTLTNSRS